MNRLFRRGRAPLIAATLLLGGGLAHATGDVQRGADVFATECAECHSVKAGHDKKGPSLFAVLGRKAASNPDFAYSDAMRQSGLTWTEDRLTAYIGAPRKTVPGGKMKYDGLNDAAQLTDLLAFLAAQH